MRLLAVAALAAALAAPARAVTQYQVFQHAVPGRAVKLVSPGGPRTTVGAFSTGDAWEFRFAPNEPGTWHWSAQGASGSFAVRRGGAGFVRDSAYNGFRWAFTDGSPYYPIGLQDCTVPLLSPDPLRFWGLDGPFTGGDYVG